MADDDDTKNESPWSNVDLDGEDRSGGTEVVLREHSEPMNSQEFFNWVNTTFGKTVSISDALQQAAFMLCCDVIAQDLAKSTLRLRERLTPKTSRVLMPEEHPIAAFLAMEPNHRHTWHEFTEMMALWSCLTQNAYAAVIRNRMGDPLELLPFQSTHVTTMIEGRDIFYEVTASSMQEQALLGGITARFGEANMIHVRGRMLDGMDGYSTMTVGRTTLGTAKALEEYRNKLFTEEGQIRGVFMRPNMEPLPDEMFARLRSQFRELMSRFRKMSEPIVLEGDLKFENIASNPEEAELVEQFDQQINQMCRLLRVPPHKVFHLDGSKYENLETMEKAYVGDTLVPVAERFESRMARALLSKKDRMRFYFEFDREEMVIKDTKAETERVLKAVERGVYTIDEARAKLGENELPKGAGKVRTIPANVNVVDENNNVVIAGTNAPKEEGDGKEDSDQGEEPAKGLRLVVEN